MEARDALRALERLVGDDPVARECVDALRTAIVRANQQGREAARYRDLLARSVRIAAGGGLDPVAGDLLEALMSVVDAPRGFFGVVETDGWRVVGGRNLDEPEDRSQFSSAIIDRALASGEPVVEVDAQEGEFSEQQSVANLALRSVACFPVGRRGARGFLYVDNPLTRGFFDDAAVDAVRAWLPLFDDWVARVISEARAGAPALPGVLTRSPILLERLSELARVARFDVPVLLWGETGTGKSLIARKLHEASPRRGRPFVHVNCAALPADLIEAELFGAEAGAYTGANRRREGRFEAANTGTLFLDELDLLPNDLQAKLLVAVQEKQVVRLGSNRPIQVDVRLVSAMSSAPGDSIAAGRLREELYFRLAVIETPVPPLRDRPEDVPLLARYALEQARARFSLPPLRLAPEALDRLLAHTWPGNVRELENALDRAALLSDEGVIARLDLRPMHRSATPPATGPGPVSSPPRFARRRYGITGEEFTSVWERERGEVRRVADSLGVTRRTVYRLKQKYIDDNVAKDL